MEQVASGMDEDRPGLGAIPWVAAPALAAASSTTTHVVTAAAAGGGGVRHRAPPLCLDAPPSPTCAVAATPMSPASPAAASPDTPFGPRVCPSFRNAALLPFSVLAPDEVSTANDKSCESNGWVWLTRPCRDARRFPSQGS